MKKTTKKVCGTKLVIETYGGGLRYACPACDKAPWAGPYHLSFTNASPPADRACKRVK